MLEFKEILKEDLRQETQELLDEGYRLAAIHCDGSSAKKRSFSIPGYRQAAAHCDALKDYFELTYTFDKKLSFQHLRLYIDRKKTVPSISPLTTAALLAENEIKDLFGIDFEGLPLDYKGRLYLAKHAEKAPQAKKLLESYGSAATAEVNSQ